MSNDRQPTYKFDRIADAARDLIEDGFHVGQTAFVPRRTARPVPATLVSATNEINE